MGDYERKLSERDERISELESQNAITARSVGDLQEENRELKEKLANLVDAAALEHQIESAARREAEQDAKIDQLGKSILILKGLFTFLNAVRTVDSSFFANVLYIEIFQLDAFSSDAISSVQESESFL